MSRHKYSCNEDIFKKDNELSFYLAGFIAADGNISNKKNRAILAIELSSKDLDFLKYLQVLFQSNHAIYSKAVKNSKRNSDWKDTMNCSFAINSKKIFNDLARFNVVPAKTKIYRFPKWLINHPLVHHFMRGYVDGDGTFGLKQGSAKNNKKIKCRFGLVGNKEFLQVYKDILEKNAGIPTKINGVHIRSDNGLGTLQYVGTHIIAQITAFLYKDATMFLPRKKVKAFMAFEFSSRDWYKRIATSIFTGLIPNIKDIDLKSITNGLIEKNKMEQFLNKKLLCERIDKIRELYATGNFTQNQLALQYNFSRPYISRIINFKIGINQKSKRLY
jgi:hypothetical protein